MSAAAPREDSNGRVQSPARPPLSIVIRSAVFNALFYLVTIVLLMIALVAMILSRYSIIWLARLWGRTNLALLRAICDIDVEWIGRE